MSDDFEEFMRDAVLGLSRSIEALQTQVDGLEKRLVHRMDGIVARLEDVETAQERLYQKMDRTQTAAVTAFEASEQALNAVTYLSRRVTRLEHPEGGSSSGTA